MDDGRTPEQIVADENLRMAIEANAGAYGMIQEGWALGDWVISVELIPFAPDLAGHEKYGMITPQPPISRHRLLGLVDTLDKGIRENTE